MKNKGRENALRREGAWLNGTFDEDGMGFSWFGPWYVQAGVMCGTFETRAPGPLTAFFVLEVDVYLLYLIQKSGKDVDSCPLVVHL